MTHKFGAPFQNPSLSPPVPDNADLNSGLTRQVQLAEAMIFNTVGNKWERQRTPGRTPQVGVATLLGNTALYTPGAGNKFRLFGYHLVLSGNASLAVAGLLMIQIRDAATILDEFDVLVPAAAGVGPTLLVTPHVTLPGNGYLSQLANNVLNINLSVALVTGDVVAAAICGEE